MFVRDHLLHTFGVFKVKELKFWSTVSALLTPLYRSPKSVFFTYLIYAFLARFYGFFRSVINWDETTYLLGGRALNQGQSLYVDFWDFKPPGVFWITAGIDTLFEEGIVPFRILGTLVVFGTAFFLYRLVLKVNPQEKLAAFFTGLFYLSAISFQSLSFGIGRGTGLEVNTEHLFLFFSVLGAYFLYARHQKVRNAALAGLALGLGFLIKYFVAFDMLALGLVLILLHWEEYRLKNWPSLLLLGLTFTACALLPFGLLNAWYYFGTDLWEVWVDITYNSGSNYSGESKGLPILKMLDAIGNVFYFSGIVSAAFIGLLVSWFRKKSPVKAPYLKGWLLWFVITLIAPMLPGKWFTHYFYQVFPAFSLLAGHFMAKALVNNEATIYRRGAILGLIMAVGLPVFGTMKYIFYFSKPDTPRQVVAYLKETVAPDRMVYCYSYYHVVNYLMGQLPPTKYYHPSLLFRKDHIAAMGIDEKAELDQIFAQEPVAVLYDCSNQDWYRLWMQGILVTPDTVFDDEAAIILWDQHQEEAALFKMVQEQKAVLPDSSSTKE